MLGIPDKYGPQIIEHEEGMQVLDKSYQGVTQGLEVVGKIFSTPDQVVKFFSYYMNHILEGTIMLGGGFNAYEYGNWSNLLPIIESYLDFGMFQNSNLMFQDSELTGDLKEIITSQLPYKTEVTESCYPHGTKQPPKILPLFIKFCIDSPNGKHEFIQQYIVGYNQKQYDNFVLVGDRNNLYSAYQKAFSMRFPIEEVYWPYQLTDDFKKIMEEDK